MDRENTVYAQKILESIKEIISKLSDENLSLEYEILECRCLQKLEKIDEAKAKYESLTKRFPEDPRAFLYLAEIYINDKDFRKNLEFLKKAEKIDKDFWLLELEKLLRKNRLEEKIDLKSVDNNNFPDDLKIRSNFYRAYALFFEDANNHKKADSFIEKAIHANPERFSNYLAKLSILENRLFSDQQILEKLTQTQELLEEIKKVEDKFSKYGDIGARNRTILNVKKLNVLRVLENFPEFEKISKETFALSIECYFDKQIEQVIVSALQLPLSDNDLNKLLKYIKNSKKEISDELSKVLIFQLSIKENLFTDGKDFFAEINNQKYIDFVNNLKNKSYKKILTFLEDDTSFATTIARTIEDEKLKQNIINFLLKKKGVSEKDLLDLFNDKHIFKILQKNGIDDLNLNYFGLKKILSIVQQKKAWDFEAIILQKLIEKEKDEQQKFNLQSQLFNARFNLKQYHEVIKIGKELLKKDATKNYLDIKNKEELLGSTIFAYLERGKIEKNSYIEAQKLLEKYNLAQSSFEFKAGIEAEVYLYNNNPQKALGAIIEGVKIKKLFPLQEYAKLYYLLRIKIGNQIDLKLTSLGKVKKNTFVKLKSKDVNCK